ncbi:uncharacterized protein LOC108674245 [Hyalella azteca]|uniref:Uncharacterized protein LOC108674245 n=1 Tax=Hyalella azteca TaxID=294128 RepID=A0A8B7NV75_HYAAZ|nr:uncharacterized protein LOC108674245 [Hyalella azteca]
MSSSPILKCLEKHVCSICSRILQSHRGLLLHIHKVHRMDKTDGYKEKKVRCQEMGCDFKCFQLSQLREHLSQCHGHSFTEIVIEFENSAKFDNFLKKFERENNVEFCINTANFNQKSKVVYYRCNRSGFYRVSKQTVQRRTKNQGSCKIEGHCTAYVKTKELFATGRVMMHLCNSHYGHDLQLVHLRVPKADKQIISSKLNTGMNFSEIIEDVLGNKPDSAQRTNLIKSKDVYNVMMKVKRKQASSLASDLPPIIPRLEKISKIKLPEKEIDSISHLPPIAVQSEVRNSDASKRSLERVREKVLENFHAVIDRLASSSDERQLYEFRAISENLLSRLPIVDGFPVNDDMEASASEGIITLTFNNDQAQDVRHSNHILQTPSFSSEAINTEILRHSSSVEKNSKRIYSSFASPEASSVETIVLNSYNPAPHVSCGFIPIEITEMDTCSPGVLEASGEAFNASASSTHTVDMDAVCSSALSCSGPTDATQNKSSVTTDAGSNIPSHGYVLMPSFEPENGDMPRVLDRAFTTFSRDGETCFVHVGNEFDDRDIKIVIA